MQLKFEWMKYTRIGRHPCSFLSIHFFHSKQWKSNFFFRFWWFFLIFKSDWRNFSSDKFYRNGWSLILLKKLLFETYLKFLPIKDFLSLLWIRKLKIKNCTTNSWFSLWQKKYSKWAHNCSFWVFVYLSLSRTVWLA